MIGREFEFDGALQPEPFILSDAFVDGAEDLASKTKYSIGEIALSMVLEPAVSGTKEGKVTKLLAVSLEVSAKMMYDICRLKSDWLDNLEEDLPVACGVVEKTNPKLRSGQMDHRRVAASLSGLLNGIYLQQFYDSGVHLSENEMKNIRRAIDKLEEMSGAK